MAEITLVRYRNKDTGQMVSRASETTVLGPNWELVKSTDADVVEVPDNVVVQGEDWAQATVEAQAEVEAKELETYANQPPAPALAEPVSEAAGKSTAARTGPRSGMKATAKAPAKKAATKPKGGGG